MAMLSRGSRLLLAAEEMQMHAKTIDLGPCFLDLVWHARYSARLILGERW